MRGTVSWACVSCLETFYRPISIKFIPYDPGATFITFWSFVLPAKKYVNIHTLCSSCMHELQCHQPEEQLAVILKKRDQVAYTKRLSWVNQQWDLWISCVECQRINEVFQETGEVILHLGNSVFVG